MGDVNRYRHGNRQLVQVPVASATVIEKGDFVVLSSGKASTPAALKAQASEGTSKKNVLNALMQNFVGIAETPSASGDTDDILVDVSTDAVFEFTQSSAADLSFGDMVEIYAYSTASSSWTARDQSVASGSDNPVAVCVRDHDSAKGTGVLCRLLPQKLLGAASWT